jgi:glycosyltransferase involved in cell wall biosynthesis
VAAGGSSPIKVLIKSPYSIYSGYGQDGWGLARALVRWGADVYLQPTWLDVPVPPDLAPLLLKTLQAPFDLTINHWSPDQLGLRVEARRCTRLAVAWTMWEFGSLKPVCKGRSTLRERLKWYDLVLGYDPVSLASLEPYIPAHVARGILLGGFDAGNWRPVERDWHGEQFGFAMHGALNNRKAPYTVLQAHLELREDDRAYRDQARLTFHTTTPPLFPELEGLLNADGDKRVRIHMDTWTDDYLKAFYAAQHCLVYPSQGEGKNVPCLEFMSTGGTVIHTRRGGPEMWLSGDVGWEVPYTLSPLIAKVPDGAAGAKVSVADLKAVMFEVFTHRDEARRRGRRAAELIPSMLDWSVVVEDLFRRICDYCGHHGQIIYDLAMRCRREDELELSR